MKRLPDSEFYILKVIWQLPNPVSSAQIVEALGESNQRKPQTLLTVLARLTEKGFLLSERKGRERRYTAIVSEEDYMEVEAAEFFHRYEGQSFGNLVKSLFSANRLTDSDMEEIRGLLPKKED